MSNNPAITGPRVDEDKLEFDDDLRVCNGEPFTGIGVEMFNDGSLESETTYIDGLPSGVCREWHRNGKIRKEWKAVTGTVHGQCMEWHEDGSLKARGEYHYGVELNYKEWNQQGELVIERTLPEDSVWHGMMGKLERFHTRNF